MAPSAERVGCSAHNEKGRTPRFARFVCLGLEKGAGMPTINQLIRHGRKRPVARTKVPAMEACPQKAWRMYQSVYK